MSARRPVVIATTEIAALIPSGATVAVGGSGSLLQVPETALEALGTAFIRGGEPRDLTVVHTMGLGNREGRGLDHISREGLVRRFIGSHFVLSPDQVHLIKENLVEAVAVPAGSISQLYREIASGRPGLVTDIGAETFVDPRLGGGKLNPRTIEGVSSIIEVDGKEWIFYPSFPIHVGLLRATTADLDGNLVMTDEAGFADNLAIAQAVRNSGGVVIAEVKNLVEPGTLPGALVKVPGALVDYLVVSEFRQQTPLIDVDPRRTGMSAGVSETEPEMPTSHRLVIARRACAEIAPGDLVNLGVGIPNGISAIWAGERGGDAPTFTIEQGHFGGVPSLGLNSGTVVYPSAVVDMTSQFDFYDGGGLDVAALGFAQVDALGNVNVSRVGGIAIGPGGFINISQKTPRVLFCGTFSGGGLITTIRDGVLEILHEGAYRKIVDTLEEVSFSAARAVRTSQRVTVITERAVFELTESGLVLTEVAPGIDVEHQVLALLPRSIQVDDDLREMSSEIFDGNTNLAHEKR